MFLTSALSCQGLVNKDLSQKISIIKSLKWKTSTRFYVFSTWGSGIVQSACMMRSRRSSSHFNLVASASTRLVEILPIVVVPVCQPRQVWKG